MARALAAARTHAVMHPPPRPHRRPPRRSPPRSSSPGGRAAALKARPRHPPPARRAHRQGRQAFGPLTVLVNNASSFEPDPRWPISTRRCWDRHLAIHAEAPALPRPRFPAAQLPGRHAGQHRQHHRRARAAPDAQLFQLHAEQGRALDHDADHGAVARAAHPRQRHRPRPDPPGDRPVRSRVRRARRPRRRSATPPMPPMSAEALLYLLSRAAITGQMLALDGGKHLDFPAQRGPTPRKAK